MESNRNRLYHSLGPVTRVPRNGYGSHTKASRYNSPASGATELPSGVGGWLIMGVVWHFFLFFLS